MSDVERRLSSNTKLGSLDLLQVLIDHLDLQDGLNLLDVGCGPGGHLRELAQQFDLKLFGIDPSISDQITDSITLKQGKAESLHFENGYFDRVMCNYAIYYIDEWKKAVDEMLRVLKNGGKIVVSGPAKENNRNFYSLHRKLFGEISRIDRHALNFICEYLEPYLSSRGISADTQTYENRIRYPTAEAFIRYYRSTSLFRFTSKGKDAKKMIEQIRSEIELLYEKGAAFENVKKIRVITVHKP